MSFERHHPNRHVDRNLAKARDLRSSYLFALLAMVAEFVARPWRLRRRGAAPPGLELTLRPMGRQCI
jgi:hypothetical protein